MLDRVDIKYLVKIKCEIFFIAEYPGADAVGCMAEKWHGYGRQDKLLKLQKYYKSSKKNKESDSFLMVYLRFLF